MRGWQAFRSGLAQALRQRRVLAALFAVNLISALLLAALPAAALATGLGYRPAVRQAADGVDAWLVLEALTSSLVDIALGQSSGAGVPPVWQQFAVALIPAAALPLLAWIPAAFLSGGALLTYAEAPRAPFRWRRFLWGCWHWFGSFLLLGILQGIVAAVLFVPLLITSVALASAIGGWVVWVAIPLVVLVAVLWLMVTDLARIVAVVDRTRQLLRALGRAVRFVLRNLMPVAVLYGLALLLTVLLHTLFRWGLLARVPLDWWPLVLLVQQVFILARLGAQLARLAGGVALYESAS
jgi:hypothetical protein